jgi:hypothetical protein
VIARRLPQSHQSQAQGNGDNEEQTDLGDAREYGYDFLAHKASAYCVRSATPRRYAAGTTSLPNDLRDLESASRQRFLLLICKEKVAGARSAEYASDTVRLHVKTLFTQSEIG